ncbi:gamma-glutamyl-gamma-aminobutyrate hydrolase family protein [Streptomyces sp. G45]|uniref:gamma-glutamyl-gamma-aminobutyrate hydrolase family protein n=1 Tax=Streptomyces sp. G45 TaxID=3406627 RepID=UPI003C136F9D
MTTERTTAKTAAAPLGAAAWVPVGITQRTLAPDEFQEVRYGLDARWFPFLTACGLTGVPLPNDPETAVRTARGLRLAGVILTGGDSLAAYGGTSPGRDATERALLDWALAGHRPVLGVCRGTQMIMDYFGARLSPVAGHVATRHDVLTAEGPRAVNSYHRLAAARVPAPLVATAHCDGVVEAVGHTDAPVTGVMWHPERESPFSPQDIGLVSTLFGTTPRATVPHEEHEAHRSVPAEGGRR